VTRQEQFILMAAITVVVLGGAALSVKASIGDNAGDSAMAGAAKFNASLRKAGADLTSGQDDPGNWQAPDWSIASSGADTLHANHPLFRRPQHAGQNRYKVMCQGWGGWYYDPPSETYF
jgi:hypothetical protein